MSYDILDYEVQVIFEDKEWLSLSSVFTMTTKLLP
jgi:hypothetical protein